MTKKHIHIIALSLAIIFLLPMTVKLFDGLFHHHDHFICTAQLELHFHKHHDKCPIPGFELSFYSLTRIIFETHKAIFCDTLFLSYISGHFSNKFEYSFLLRAPPVNTNIAQYNF